MSNVINVVDMYKKGYSIDYIINEYYKFKTRYDNPNKKIGNLVFINKKSITKEDSKKEVYEEIFNFVR